MDTALLADLAARLPATELAFRQDAYRREAEGRVLGEAEGLLVLDRVLFYPASGGQPADFGSVSGPDGVAHALEELRYLDAAKSRIGIRLAGGAGAGWTGATVTQHLDFERRHKLMRMHTALHLLSVLLKYPVTGGAVGTEEGRLDFDIPDAGLDKEALTAELNALVARDAKVSDQLISEAELDANPGLVKTMSVKPPRGTGFVRLVEIEGLDLQPCGGTHVARTGEIGRLAVTNIEKKGKINRRVRVGFA